jgi:hypothetical protein
MALRKDCIWLLRKTYDKLTELKAASKIGAQSQKTSNSWIHRLNARGTAPGVMIRVEADVLARFCLEVNLTPEQLKPENLPLHSEADRDQLKSALQKLIDQSAAGAPCVFDGASLRAKLPERLFGPARKLVGELIQLFWSKQVRVVTICGDTWTVGGIGKTSVVKCWLAQLGKRPSETGRMFTWSFNDQSHPDNSHTSTNGFLATALDFFGDPQPNQGTPERRAARLADRLCAEPARPVLVLDGLEPLQHPPLGDRPAELKHQALTILLRALANPKTSFRGFCVLTSRLRVIELAEFEGKSKGDTARLKRLGHLSAADGRQLLQFLGVTGRQKQLEETATEFSGHPLTLRLLGSYLTQFPGGDVVRARAIRNLHEEVVRRPGQERAAGAEQFLRMMAWYTDWYEGKPELCLLRLLSLFDGQAPEDAVESLLHGQPAIDHLTDLLQDAHTADWRFLADELQAAGLLQVTAPPGGRGGEARGFDLHPSIRAYLADDLRRRFPEAWKQGQRRLCELFSQAPVEQPESLAQLLPLYRAVAHGCRAGEHKDAFWKVYWARIVRPDPATEEGQFFILRRFGCFEEELRVMAHFFLQPWDRAVPDLDVRAQGLARGIVGFCLRSTGKLAEARHLLEASEGTLTEAGDLLHACRVGGYLSETLRTLGKLKEARLAAEDCVHLADRTGNLGQRVYQRTTLADVLHWQGETAAARAWFEEARDLLPGRLLPSIPSVRYCELLLTLGKYQEVADQAENALRLDGAGVDRLAAGLHRVYLAFARFKLTKDPALRTEGPRLVKQAIDEDLREASFEEHLALGWLILARMQHENHNWGEAKTALETARQISRSCSAKLTEADCHLELVRQRLDRDGGSVSAQVVMEVRARLDDDDLGKLVKDEYRLLVPEWNALDGRLKALPASPTGRGARRSARRP